MHRQFGGGGGGKTMSCGKACGSPRGKQEGLRKPQVPTLQLRGGFKGALQAGVFSFLQIVFPVFLVTGLDAV